MALERQFRPIRTLSAYVAPPGGHVVVALKTYLDDSGDGDAPTETFLTIGGYLADEDGWAYFEPRWNAIMAEAGVPWLHMKDFGDPNSPIYGHLKADPDKERTFMKAVIALIKESARGSVATTIPMDEFRAFNRQHGLDLDPYAFAIYGCLFQLRSYHPNDEIEIVLDSFDNSASRAAKALQYFKTDSLDNLKPDLFTPIPLQKKESWRDVKPLQAADLIAWEVRKYRRERASLKPPLEIREDREAMHRFAVAWEDAQEKKPRDRFSFQSLRQGMIFRPLHIVADTHALNVVLSRHSNGWGVP